MKKLNLSINKQKGAVLILIAFIIGLATAAYLLHALDPARLRAAQDKKTYQTLNKAKQALIAWSVNHPNTPGLMPYPDRNNDLNYDDTADCYASNVNFAPQFTLGRLPLFKNDPNCVNAKVSVTSGVSEDFRDGSGERLWYEVSNNLLHDYKNNGGNSNGTSPIINPSIINTPTNPWFVVRDRNGVVVSDRVAAVIISPGAPSGAQDRSVGIANANQYLDRIVMADNTPYQNYAYQDPATNPVQEFIIGDDFRVVAKNDSTYKDQTIEPYYYNDKLVYITIDELMAALEKRVGEEVRANLAAYATTNGGDYPFAATLGGAGSTVARKYRCSTGRLIGALPIDNPADTCRYSATATAVSASCNFQDVAATEFRGVTGTFDQATGDCVRAGSTRCTCTGAGSCRHSINPTVFSCNASGNCSGTNITGAQRVRFLGTGFDTVDSFCTLAAATSACPQPANYRIVTCNNTTGSVIPTVSLGYICAEQLTTLPAWFAANRWQDYVFYETTRPTNMAGITVGNKITGAMLATVGRSILPQVRPSCAPNNYLDSAENVSTNSLYDPTFKQRTNTYNDQTFVVAP